MNVNDIEKIAKDLTDQATLVAKQYGPQAWNVICGVKRIDSIGYLVIGFILLIVGIFSGLFLRALTRHHDEWGWSPDACIASIVASIVGVFLGVIGICMVLNVWNWVGISDPGLAIAHDVIEKALAPRN